MSQSAVIEAFIDGSRVTSTTEIRTGFGIYWPTIPELTYSGELDKSWTCARAEVYALFYALRTIYENVNSFAELRAEIRINCDNIYCVKGYSTWLNEWQRNGFRKADNTPLANEDLWREIYEMKTFFVSNSPLTIYIVHVKSHAGNQGNEIADSLAKGIAPTQTSQIVTYKTSYVRKQTNVRKTDFILSKYMSKEEITNRLQQYGYDFSFNPVPNGEQLKSRRVNGAIIFYNNGNVFPQGEWSHYFK